MFENVKQPLATRPIFIKRVLRYFLFGIVFITIVLLIGTAGYCFFENMSLIDAFTNSALTLADMGLVTPLLSTGGKLFAAIYALLSGLIFFSVAGLIFAPIIHRFFHVFHLDSFNSPDN